MVLKVDELIRQSREKLINQQMESVAHDVFSYVRLRDIVLRDYADFPVVTQGVMQPTSGLANASDFMHGLSLLGDRVPVHLFNLDGELVYSTDPESHCLQQTRKIETFDSNVNAERIHLKFCRSKNGGTDSWMLITPVSYNLYIEGYLAAEIATGKLVNDLALNQYAEEYHLSLMHGDEVLLALGNIAGKSDDIVSIPELGIELHYRSDASAIANARESVVINFTLFLSFLMFIIIFLSRQFGNAYFVRPLEELRELTKKLADNENIPQSDWKKVRINEIRDLEENFRSMAEKVARRELSLKSANDSLQNLNEKTIQQQQMLVHSEKLASVGQLAAGVAHEINNPTSYVKGNLELLQQYARAISTMLPIYQKMEDAVKLQGGDDTQLQELENLKKQHDLDYILGDIGDLTQESLDGVTRIQSIVKDLKSFSRVDDDTMKKVNLNEDVIGAAIRLVSSEIRYKCEIIENLAELPLVECRSGEISQVVMNLLMNARDSIEEQGTITISSFTRDDSVFMSVIDTGSGISDQQLLKLFDPFYTTKKVGLGTGLGLSICQAIVQNHHGDIKVKSQLGKGSEFTVRLPIQRRDPLKRADNSQGADAH